MNSAPIKTSSERVPDFWPTGNFSILCPVLYFIARCMFDEGERVKTANLSGRSITSDILGANHYKLAVITI